MIREIPSQEIFSEARPTSSASVMPARPEASLVGIGDTGVARNLLIDPTELLGDGLRNAPISRPLGALISRVFSLNGVNQLYARVAAAPPGIAFFEAILSDLKLTVRISDDDLRRIPTAGSVVAVANHPFGAIEGIVLAWILARVRPDVRVMANFLLQRLPQMNAMVIPVDPFGRGDSKAKNLRGMREALTWLRRAGALGIFPSGEVSHWDSESRRVEDPAWNPNVARLIRHTHASAIPIFFQGANGFPFQVAGFVHPRLRTAWLAKELLNKRNHVLDVRVGTPILPETLHAAGTDEECIALLRKRVYFLSNRGSRSRQFPALAAAALPIRLPVAMPKSSGMLAAEIDALPPHSLLAEQGDFAVFVSSWQQSPAIVREIGRLRELTFRHVGEGTGKALDLDRFDEHYEHLFVWNRVRRELVGAYRLAHVHEVLSQRGIDGLYIASLFRFESAFFRHLGKAIELGRSFVRKEYQRSYAPLMLLWKGIGKIVLRDHSCVRLLGPVSISADYSLCSRQILVDYLSEQNLRQPEGVRRLCEFVRPRRPFHPRRIMGWDQQWVHTLLPGIDDLSTLIADIEADGKGIPVLLRQYLRLNGSILAFNVDTRFANVLDGLILVDLRETDPRILAKHLGKEGARAVQSRGVADKILRSAAQ